MARMFVEVVLERAAPAGQRASWQIHIVFDICELVS